MSNLPSLGPRGEGWVAVQVVILGAVALAGIALPGTWDSPAATLASVAGSGLVGCGVVLVFGGIAELRRGDAFTPLPRPLESGRLVVTGVYRLVRHPVYGGLVLGAVGWALIRVSIPTLVTAVILFAFFDLKRRREEAWLVRRFAAYEPYRRRTHRLIPWLY